MFPLLDLAEKVWKKTVKLSTFRAKLAGLLRDSAARAGELIKIRGEKIRNLIPPGIQKRLPWLEGKPGFALVCLGFVLSVLLVVLVRMIVSSAGPGADREQGVPPWNPAEISGLIREAPIPPEELFLPDEPDFLPGVIPERERRSLWTAEDAEPYWYNPLEGGTEEWRNRIKAVLDEFLEHVP